MITLRDIKEKILSKIETSLSYIRSDNSPERNESIANRVKLLSEAYKILNDIKED